MGHFGDKDLSSDRGPKAISYAYGGSRCISQSPFPLRQFEQFDKLVAAHDPVCFPGAPTCGNVFNLLRSKCEGLAVEREAGLHILIYEAFSMELPQYKLLSTFVEAHQPPVFMDLSPGFFA